MIWLLAFFVLAVVLKHGARWSDAWAERQRMRYERERTLFAARFYQPTQVYEARWWP